MINENDQLEPPPRLYIYNGFFTTYRSVDLALKIIFVIAVFIMFVLILAWIISRKSYRRAPTSKRLQLKCISNLFIHDERKLFSAVEKDSIDGTVTTSVAGYTVTVISHPDVIARVCQSRCLKSYFSVAPGKLRRSWCGLLLSDSILPHRKILRKTILQAFNTLPAEVYQLICANSTDPSDIGTLLLSKPNLTEKDLKQWLSIVITQLLLLGPPNCASSESPLSLDKLDSTQFSRNWWSNIDVVRQFHIFGKNEEHVTSEELLADINDLLKPIILHSFEHIVYRNLCSGPSESKKQANTFLMQLLLTHHHIERFGKSLDFLSVSHVAHILSELALLLDHVLSKTLHLLFFALGMRPCWQSRARAEVLNYKWINSLQYREDKLNWTQAMIHEAVRLGMISWPYSCIREVCQDGACVDYDLAEGDLVLMNHVGYLFGSQYWGRPVEGESEWASVNSGIDPSNFCPLRFLTQPGETLSIPEHWKQYLKDALICIPYKTVHQLLLELTVDLLRRGFQIHCLVSSMESERNATVDDALNVPDRLPEIFITSTSS